MESPTTSFKQKLALVFDEDFRTRPLKWNNYVDFVIIGMIVLSTVAVFLETFPLSDGFRKALRVFDWVVQIFFTIEVTLRIWTADEIDPKFKGFWGRVRYCFSFYGLIDFLATYPVWLGLSFPAMMSRSVVQGFRVLRVARLFRVFRYMNASKFMGQAFRSKKKEMLVSLEFLTVITIVLSFILYLVEHDSNPVMLKDGWRSIVWSFAKYIGDPGKIANDPLSTTIGQIIAFLVGILGIAIFAVPIGLLSSGFSEAVEEDKKIEQRKENVAKLKNLFVRRMDRPTRYQVVPQFVPFTDIKVKANLSEEEILEAVAHGSGFRVINTASTIPAKDNPTDRMAVEHFIVNRPYGCCIDRKSKVTIISTSSHDNPLVGNFAYYLAKLGGFNYVSREFGDVLQGSYYIPKVEGIPGLDEFMDDINALTDREDAWTVTILAASGAQEPEYPEEVHIGYGAAKGQPALDAPGLTIHDAAKAEQVFSALEGILSTEFGITAERQMRHSSNASYLYLRNLKNADKVNSFILRIAWSAMAWNPDRIRIAQSMADTLHGLLDLDNPREELSCLMIKDVGYANYGDLI